jgi:hypothetical protein
MNTALGIIFTFNFLLYLRMSPIRKHLLHSIGKTSKDKLKLTGRNLGRIYNSKLRYTSVYAMQLHT